MIAAIIVFFLCFIASQTLLVFMPYATTAAMPLSSETDKLALLALKVKLTNGNHDNNALPSWNESLHFCEWQGVTCSRRHKRVSALQLQNQDLGGTLGPTLGNLTFLKKLNLTNVNLYGEIPREVGRLKRLQILCLDMNNVHGEVPMEITNCSKLEVVFLMHNNLTGKVPSWFGSMVHLTWLQLGANNLAGRIPPSLGNLSSLETLSLAYNHLEGNIPHVLGRLSNLNYIFLGSNNLSGMIPPSLYNLSNIRDFHLGKNQLVGTLPSNIDHAFPNLQQFTIPLNQFTGTFPSSISNLSQLQLFDIGVNSFRGPIPLTLGRLNKLQVLIMDYNNLGSGQPHDLDFLSSLTNLTQLQRLSFEANNLGGVLPDLIGNLSTHLYLLDMWVNQISGRIPQTIGNLIGLTTLILAQNSLEGSIPDSVGKLKNLARLNLQQNKLSGNIPCVIGNLTMLSEVYLGINELEGSLPFTLRYCSMMQKFVVDTNYLSGNIPNNTFGYQKGLITLDLSINALTGSVPSDFGNLKQLSILYLHTNNLSGEVPLELGACSALTDFWLTRNFFHGSIPSFFGSLRNLENLDFSINNFSGTIPNELENLTFLNYLNLSFNHLYGEVPIGGIFRNITAMSLIGNEDLCGGIPQLNLPPCPELLSHKHKSSFKVTLIIVISGVSASFLVFICICYLRKKPKTLSSSPSLEHRYLKVSYGELHQATDGFSSSNLVGTGSFGSVYKGTLVQFERPIAVKVLNLQTHGASKSFMAECKALGKIRHRNLLNILTCCSSLDYKGDDFKAIVFDFMSNGSLETLLHNNEEKESKNLNLNFEQRVNIALDVAFALDYLHNDSEEAIVHCDVKPSNVLLDDDMVAHLGDFGLARLLHGHGGIDCSSGDHVSSSAIKGTIGYLPPEYGAGGSVSAEGDMYSYGILLLEMITGKKPTDSIFGEGLSLHLFCNMAILEGISEIVDSRLLIPITEQEGRRVTRQQNMEDTIRECLVSFTRIGIACSEKVPSQRMGIKDVIMELHAIKQKLLS
ncbi:probable LRR receptor-like serine/threonine-protein kinase At3g47570 [Arachis duranensis]|uniref:non-specific serine/threonine protein kinase n=1 Tax=Arachis duranensis TaxID=130453 RepID=A0A6P4AV37_ARADU|nr:probable LRR receptor-like serine/threonine-protein kinase At3g47570 [Arachis duranensis]